MTTTSLAGSGAHPALSLAFDLEFADLYRREGLIKLDELFARHLTEAVPALADRLREARGDPEALEPKSESELLIALAPHLETFIAELFGLAA